MKGVVTPSHKVMETLLLVTPSDKIMETLLLMTPRDKVMETLLLMTPRDKVMARLFLVLGPIAISEDTAALSLEFFLHDQLFRQISALGSVYVRQNCSIIIGWLF